MSQFDKYTTPAFVDSMRVFLGIKNKGFLKKFGFIDEKTLPKRGRLPRYKREAVQALVELVNEKAELSESSSTSIGGRIQIARDYKLFSDAKLADKLNVSRELVRLWRGDVHKPGNLVEVAKVLDVPLLWLNSGIEEFLPANSHIGVRVGCDAIKHRERLYSMTVMAISNLAEDADLQSIQAHLEHEVSCDLQMKKMARRAGGRWHFDGKELIFAPWVPIEQKGLSRRYWSDEVEAIIENELTKAPSVYAAWVEIEKRCTSLGMTAEMFPKRISIYKRVEKQRKMQSKFGVNINAKTESFRTNDKKSN